MINLTSFCRLWEVSIINLKLYQRIIDSAADPHS